MGGSAAEAPTSPDAQPSGGMRASDAERDEVVAKLKEEFAAGRLSQDTFLYRVNEVLNARHQADLPPLVADLPAPAGPAGRETSLLGRLRAAWPRRPQLAAVPASAPADDRPGRPGRPGQAGQHGRAAQAGQVGRDGQWLPAPSAGGLVRRLTASLPRASANARQPVPLQFPRGAGRIFSIGRDANCDLAIADMTVSRVHARLERTPDGWTLTDLASTNGTRVNGWRVHGQVRVRAGDLVSFGDAEYWLGAADGI
jgi:FHA domain/Domain of unknown function (DUF1707)